MMVASGLSDKIALWFVHISTETTLPFLTFISAGLINMFIPSGGGQWAVQGPIMIPAAIELGADTARVAMAVAWGDAWTNMIQPFWALPVLAIAGLKVRDIMGFCLILLIWSFVPISIGLLFFLIVVRLSPCVSIHVAFEDRKCPSSIISVSLEVLLNRE